MHRQTVPFFFGILFIAGLLLPLVFLDLFHLVQPGTAPAAPLVVPLWEQTTLFVAAFIVKPLYMALALVIAFLLRRRAAVELVALKWSMLLFFFGELACAGNYLFFRDGSLWLEYGHNYGMVAAFVLFSYALAETFDARIIHYSAPRQRCALLPLCGGCYKQREMRCSLLTLFLYLLPALAAMAAVPLTAPLASRFRVGTIFGETVVFGHFPLAQVVEVRFFPLLAAFFLLLAFAVLLAGGERRFAAAKVLFALGSGPLAFALMRFLCFWGFAEHPLWADVWEELTEFIFIVVLLRVVLLVRARSRRHGSDAPPAIPEAA